MRRTMWMVAVVALAAVSVVGTTNLTSYASITKRALLSMESELVSDVGLEHRTQAATLQNQPSPLANMVPPGVDAASFARLGLGTRALGMAGAYVAVAEGPVAGYWNPAGLSTLADFQLEGMYTNWLGADIHYQYISVAGYPPLGKKRSMLRLGDYPVTFGLTWLSVNVAGIPWWEEEGSYGTFDAWSHLVILSMALPLTQTPSLAIGGNVKLYHDRILEGQSLGLGYDVGFLWRAQVAEIPVQVGLCTTDLGSTAVRWSGTTGEAVNYVPWLIRVGGAVELWEERLLLAVSYEWGLDRPRFERFRIGGEVRLDWLSLRAGWDQPLTGDPGKLAGGVGINPWVGMVLEYVFLLAPLGDTHLVALGVAF